jgi:hypothetical protein
MMPVSNREGERHWNSKLSEEEVTFLLTVHDEYMQERRALKLMSPDVVCRDLNYRSTDIYYDIINGKHRPRIPQFIRDLVLDNEAKRKLKREVVKRLSPEVIAPQYRQISVVVRHATATTHLKTQSMQVSYLAPC